MEKGGPTARKRRAGGRTTRHFTARRNADLVRDVSDIKKLVKDKSAEIVDARAPERFAGNAPEPRPGLRSGHIPGAHNLPYGKLLNQDGTLKSAPELERLFAEAGVELVEAGGDKLRLGHHRQRAGAGARPARPSQDLGL